MTRKPKSAPRSTRPELPREHAADTPGARYAASLILADLARRGVEVGQSPDALRGQRARALESLRATPEGTKLAGAIRSAVDGAGPLLRAAKLATVETRGSAIEAAQLFVGWVAEHQGIVDSPSAVAHLLGAARMAAAEARVHDDALARGLTGDALAEALKLADRCATCRRYDFDAALKIHREAVAARPRVWPWQSAPVAPVARPMAQGTREAEPDEPIDPEPSSGEDEADPDDGADDHQDEVERDPTPILGRELEAVERPRTDRHGLLLPGEADVTDLGRLRRSVSVHAGPPIDPMTGRLVAKAGGPGPEALAEMRKRGIDVSRWEASKEDAHGSK